MLGICEEDPTDRKAGSRSVRKTGTELMRYSAEAETGIELRSQLEELYL